MAAAILFAAPEACLAQSSYTAESRALALGADQERASGDCAKAIPGFKAALAINPNDPWSIYQLGACELRTKDYDGAIARFSLTAASNEWRLYSLVALAKAYALKGDLDHAFAKLDEAAGEGFDKEDILLTNDDWAALRKDPRFLRFLKARWGDFYDLAPDRAPTAAEIRAGARFAADRIARIHPAPYRLHGQAEWQARVNEISRKADRMDECAYMVELMALASMAGDVHTSAFPTGTASVFNASLPLRIWKYSDGLYVRAVAPGHEDLLGAKILKIGTFDVDSGWEGLYRKFPYENRSMSTYMLTFFMLFPDFHRGMGWSTDRKVGRLTVQTRSGETKDIVVEATGPAYAETQETALGQISPKGWIEGDHLLAQEPLWLKFRSEPWKYAAIPEHHAMFLQVNRPPDDGDEFGKLVDRMFAEMAQNHYDRLIIDLRHNPGGWDGEFQTLVAGIHGHPDVNRPNHLFVITSRSSQSAAVVWAAGLERFTNAIFVGEPPGAHPNLFNGPNGNHPRVPVPGGPNFGLRVSSLQSYASSNLDARVTIWPDVEATMSYGDYESGRDRALDAVFALGDEQAMTFFRDLGGRDLPNYLRWWRPSQAPAFPDGRLPRMGYLFR
jgi:tetratricopeptide (TPR) repeat protein